MSDVFEIKIQLRDEETNMTKEILHYADELLLSGRSVEVIEMVDKAKEDFPGSPDDVIVKIKYIWHKNESKKELDRGSD